MIHMYEIDNFKLNNMQCDWHKSMVRLLTIRYIVSIRDELNANLDVKYLMIVMTITWGIFSHSYM